MATSNIKYVVISPVRDEAAHLPRTIESVARQTVRPVEWIIVNDGSSDKTGAIIDEGTRKFPWLRAIHRSNRGFRKPGGGVGGLAPLYNGAGGIAIQRHAGERMAQPAPVVGRGVADGLGPRLASIRFA